MNFINEHTVLEFYLDRIEKEDIAFLKGRKDYSEGISKEIRQLLQADTMHSKIEVSKKLWKLLFEAAMSHIDPDKRGYDDLFAFFDEYVSFEELIFASDSFYRDHTIHCLWVYFLGEYMANHDDFRFLMKDILKQFQLLARLRNAFDKVNKKGVFDNVCRELQKGETYVSNVDSIRCISALTHDLGYPLKKIHKINKSIGRVLPYFSINNYDEFNFRYDGIQQHFVTAFLELMSSELQINIDTSDVSFEDRKRSEALRSIIFEVDPISDELTIKNVDALDSFSDEDIAIITNNFAGKTLIKRNVDRYLRYCKDLEEYQHGIMSAFLLAKVIKAFTNTKFRYFDNVNIQKDDIDLFKLQSIIDILTTVSDHTSSGYKLKGMDSFSDFLILIDELEEFSRISRANQNRQYVNEFCKTAIHIINGVLTIDFVFDNEGIFDLDPEKAFKSKCKRFLSLFDISNLSEDLKIEINFIGRLSSNKNTYSLEIARKYANIKINGEEKDIPQYLKSREFYRKEEY